MKPAYLTALAAALVAGIYLGVHGLAAAPAPPATKPAPATDTLHFADGAEQLSFLDIQPVQAQPQPVLEALPGKITFDEDHTVRVFAPVSGRVAGFGAALGSTVKAGDVLVWLSSPEFAQAQADARKANSDLALKRKADQRATALVAAGVLALKDSESAHADVEQAQAEATRAQQRLRQLDAGEQSGERYPLRAPIDGVLVDRSINPGMEVRPDATTPLFTLTDPTRLWTSFELSERDFGKLRIGQAVEVEVDAWPGERFRAQVFFIGAALDPATRRILARAALDNHDGRLRPEMFARISPLGAAATALAVLPNSALITLGIHHYAFVEESPGVLKRRELQLAFAGREQSYVQSGLSAGERVVTRGAVLLNAELGGAD